MKAKPHPHLAASIAAFATLSSSAWAGNLSKANNSDALETGSSWVGGTAPTGSGTAYFDANTVSTAENRTTNLGSDVTWGTIRADGGTGAFAINSSGDNTITLNGTTDASARLDSILLNSSAGPSLTIGANLSIGSNNTYFTSSRNLTINGDINLGANTLKLFPAGSSSVIEMNGIVSGSAASNVNALFTDQGSGTGTIRLTNAANSFTGRIELGSNASGMRLEFTSAGALGNTSEIRFRNTGGTAGLGSILRYTGTTDETLSQTIQCDTSIGMRIESNSVGGSLTLNGNFNQSNRGLYLGGSGTGDNTLNMVFNGSGSLAKRDGGKWVLTGNNGYSGATNITGGILQIGNGGTAGTLGSGAVSVGSGTQLIFNRSSDLTVSNTISGAGLVTKKGAGRMTVNGNNSAGTVNWNFTGTGNGDIGFSNANAIGGSGSTITLAADAIGSAFLGSSGNTSNVGINLGSGSTFTWNGSTGNTNTLSGTITGDGNFTKVSGETLILSGSNNYDGTTTVESGTLRINGTQTGTGDVNVNAGTRLEGTGSVAGVINVSGVLAPGASIESFGSGAVSFTTGSTFDYELDSNSLGGDLLASTGTLNIASGAALTLSELASGILAEGSKLTLISYDGGWVNTELFTYLGSPLVDDSTFTLGSNTWLFNYDDTTGGSNFSSDQAGATAFVTMTVIPEPGAALLGGLGALLLLRRRRLA